MVDFRVRVGLSEYKFEIFCFVKKLESVKEKWFVLRKIELI